MVRVLIGPLNTAGGASRLASALRAAGIDAESAAIDHSKGTPLVWAPDRRLPRRWSSPAWERHLTAFTHFLLWSGLSLRGPRRWCDDDRFPGPPEVHLQWDPGPADVDVARAVPSLDGARVEAAAADRLRWHGLGRDGIPALVAGLPLDSDRRLDGAAGTHLHRLTRRGAGGDAPPGGAIGVGATRRVMLESRLPCWCHAFASRDMESPE